MDESIIAEADPYAAASDLSPRTIELIRIVPPRFISPGMHALFPREAAYAHVPGRDTADYLKMVDRVLTVIASAAETRLTVSPSPVWQSFCSIINHESFKPIVREYILERPGRELVLFLLCYLQPIPIDVPADVKDSLEVLLASFFYECEDYAPAQQAMDSIIIAFFQWETNDALNHVIESLLIPRMYNHVARGMMLLGMLGDRKFRQEYYESLPKHVRPRPFSEYHEITRYVRTDVRAPSMIIALLKQYPPRFPGTVFEQEFVDAIYPDREPPDDVGRQALVFAAPCVKQVWLLMGWSTARAIRERLQKLAMSKWRVKDIHLIIS